MENLLVTALAIFFLVFSISWMVGGRGLAFAFGRWTLGVFRRLVGALIRGLGQLILVLGRWVAGGGRRRQQERQGQGRH